MEFWRCRPTLATGLVCLLLSAVTACNGLATSAESLDQEDIPRIVATTTLVGDVVKNVGGNAIDLKVLLPPGSDPHSFEATPQDVATLSNADLVFVSGLGSEEFLEPILEEVRTRTQVVSVSDGIDSLVVVGSDHAEVEASHEKEEGELVQEVLVGSRADRTDPHVWFSPPNVAIWARNIEEALTRLNPPSEFDFASNAEAFRSELRALDAWIEEQVEKVPRERRKLVTDHDFLGYFAQRYDFELVATIVPGYSTLAQPSAQDLAALAEEVEALEVPAVFIGTFVNTSLSEQIARETGVRLVPIYTGSLSDDEGPAGTYLEFMRSNVMVIVDALSLSQ